MAVTVSAMFIPVHDPDAALGFYRGALGLEVRNHVRGPRPVFRAGIGRGGVSGEPLWVS
jgi:catechol 2,3-dioxygenase-like lactoylglutathione lyase family enzyme